jgi:hypothetical protein
MTNVSSTDPGKRYWDIFDKIYEDVGILHDEWALFEQLYCKNGSRIKLLGKVATSFFYRLQFMMIRDVMLSIYRLTDRPENGRNLVLESLHDQLDELTHSSLRKDLDQRLNTIRDLAEPLKKYRHKRIAHRDKKVAFGKRLPGASLQLVADTLKGIGDLMNAVQFRFHHRETFWEVTTIRGDGDDLVEALKKSLAYESLLEKGVVDRNDPLPFAEA